MFSELIYTRCRQGIDILKEGRPITSDGYKVYSCTSSILQDGKNDLPFMLNAAQAKQPYADPSFMDDAYLYFVPDKGDSFMINFCPVPYDPNAKGDYSHRAGNFVNQILIGDYTGFYPFELFRDNSIWNAKTRGESYYYENDPADLPPRNDISDPAGQFGLDEINAFISDGRKEAFMNAVSFLITQYELPPEGRKFLVIRDDSAEKIELWIAAIEHAFSPRIAAAIPFATRMDKLLTTNRYTVNQLGAYQAQINLQDRNQKLRYRAMIVGVDERDKANATSVRQLANSPFVLLDGKEKRAMFEAETSNRYFHFITSYNEAHQSFCRKFLQSINITAPNADIYSLLDIFMIFEEPSLPNAVNMAKITNILGKYSLFNSSMIQSIYARITAELPRFLQEDLKRALQIIKWLQVVSRVVDDVNASKRLTGIVCEVFANQVYKKSDADGTIEFWQNIKNSEFVTGVATHFVDRTTLQNNQAHLRQFKSADVVTFTLIYFDCALHLNTVRDQDLQSILKWSFEYCCDNNDTDSARKILKFLSQNKHISIQDMLFAIASRTKRTYADFIVKFIIEYDESILASDSAMMNFVKKLDVEGLRHLVVSVLKFRIRSLSRIVEIDQFIKLLKRISILNNLDLVELYEALDKKLVITDKNSLSVALTIYEGKPANAICPNATHLKALDILNNKREREQLKKIYDGLMQQQGFPSLENPEYIQTLTEKLLKVQLSVEELKYIVKLFSRVPAYISELVSTILSVTTSKRNVEWCILVAGAAKNRDRFVDDAILSECVKLKQGEKAIAQLFDMLKTKEARAYFHQVAEKAKGIIRAKKSQSGFGLFGGKK